MYKVFTIAGADVQDGAEVQDFTFRNGEIVIQALIVGEEGRGRKLGVLPIAGATAGDTVFAASVAKTRSGKPKLLTGLVARSDKKAVVVMRTHIGYRGGNEHTGDAGAEFPGEIIAEGVIAQGAAGYAGCGDQLIAVIPKGIVFRTGYSGRLYGAPDEHFYMFDGEKIIALTDDERGMADLF